MTAPLGRTAFFAALVTVLVGTSCTHSTDGAHFKSAATGTTRSGEPVGAPAQADPSQPDHRAAAIEKKAHQLAREIRGLSVADARARVKDAHVLTLNVVVPNQMVNDMYDGSRINALVVGGNVSKTWVG